MNVTTSNKRLLALDVMRGITIAGMILVNTPGSWQHAYAPLKHAEWIGLTPTDLVFPFFMFIMGIALRAYRSNYELGFAIKGLITNMNYIPLIVVFVFMIAGVLFAIKSGFKTINENSDNTFKSI